MSRLEARGAASCQYAAALFRWIDQPPEDFVAASTVDASQTRLPTVDADHRLRWNLANLHAALNAERRSSGLTWAELADQLGCTAGRLTNLKTATHADLALVVHVTQWLERPSPDFMHPAVW